MDSFLRTPRWLFFAVEETEQRLVSGFKGSIFDRSQGIAMSSWWRSLRLLSTGRRRGRRKYARRRLGWGLEKFEERRLLAGFAVSESDGGTMVGEAGDGDTLTVALTAQPESDVVLRLTSEDATEVVVDPSVLTFTPVDWASPQTVSVVGVDDPLIDGPQTTRVPLT